MAHWHTPREDWPTRIEADAEPPTGPASPPEVQAALVAAVVALQASAGGPAPWDAALEEQIAHAADQAETDRLFAEIGLAE